MWTLGRIHAQYAAAANAVEVPGNWQQAGKEQQHAVLGPRALPVVLFR